MIGFAPGEMRRQRERLGTTLYLVLSKKAWDWYESLPGTNETLREAERELAAGGGVLYEVHGKRLKRAKPPRECEQ